MAAFLASASAVFKLGEDVAIPYLPETRIALNHVRQAMVHEAQSGESLGIDSMMYRRKEARAKLKPKVQWIGACYVCAGTLGE